MGELDAGGSRAAAGAAVGTACFFGVDYRDLWLGLCLVAYLMVWLLKQQLGKLSPGVLGLLTILTIMDNNVQQYLYSYLVVLLYICQILIEELQAVHLLTSSQIFRVKAVLDNTETYCTLIHNCEFAPVGFRHPSIMQQKLLYMLDQTSFLPNDLSVLAKFKLEN